MFWLAFCDLRDLVAVDNRLRGNSPDRQTSDEHESRVDHPGNNADDSSVGRAEMTSPIIGKQNGSGKFISCPHHHDRKQQPNDPYHWDQVLQIGGMLERYCGEGHYGGCGTQAPRLRRVRITLFD